MLEDFKNKLDTYLQGKLGPAVEQEGWTNEPVVPSCQMINFNLRISHKSHDFFILELKHLKQRRRIMKAPLRRQFQSFLHFLHEPLSFFYIPYMSLQSTLHPAFSFGSV